MAVALMVAAHLKAAVAAPLPPPGDDEATADADVTLACIAAQNAAPGSCGPAQAGILRWLWEVRRRTSVAIAPRPKPLRWRDGPPREPLLLWAGSGRLPPLDAAERANLSHFLHSGGTLLVDADDARGDSPFVAQIRRELEGLHGSGAVVPVPREHVLYKSFYLAGEVQGQQNEPLPAEGLLLAGRLAALLLHHNLFGSLADHQDHADTDRPQARKGEMDLRFAINFLLLALCGDYKNDHVHLPFILKRRQ